MRALILLGIMVVVIPMSFFAPFAGLLSFISMAYTRPHEWAYDASAQYSLAVAVATLAGYFAFELPRKSPRILVNLLVVLLLIQYSVSTVFAFSTEFATTKYIELTKIIVFALLTTAMVNTEDRVKWVFRITLGTIGVLSLRSFVGIILSGGGRVYGPGGQYEDNNDYATLLNLAWPMIFFLARSENVKWRKLMFYGMTATSIITVLFTYSRGGFLGLCAATVALALKSKYKAAGLAGVLLAGILFFSFAPAEVLSRVNTIKTATKEDSSAQQRLRAWGVSLRIIQDHPLLGVGIRNILLVYGMYGDPADTRVCHNSYLQITTDAGLPALILFVSLIALSYYRLSRTISVLNARAPDSPMIRYATGMQIGIFGYIVSAFFVSKEDLELLYTVIGLSASFILLSKQYESEGAINDSLLKSQTYSPTIPVAGLAEGQ